MSDSVEVRLTGSCAFHVPELFVKDMNVVRVVHGGRV